MATTDWREVYRQERRRPAYVIENGRGIVKLPVVRTWWKPKHRAQLIQEDQGRMSPRAPKRPCSHPGCGVLTDSGKCERHRIQERRELESRRPNAVAKGYGYRWRIASRAYLVRNPLCVE